MHFALSLRYNTLMRLANQGTRHDMGVGGRGPALAGHTGEPGWGAALGEGMMEEVEVTVTAVLLEILEIQPEAIVPTARFVEDLQATSIDLVEIIAVLQNTFDVEIDEAQVVRLRTVQDARDLFQAAVAAKRGAS
jgi:acyl carrier protein